MNKAKFLFAFLLTASVAAQAAEITKVIVRQQWPWSDAIKVEYVIRGVTSPVDISVTAFDGDTELQVPASALSGDVCGIDRSCVGTLMIDPLRAFGTDKVNVDGLKVKLTAASSPHDPDEVLYKIFDLASGACEDVTRKDLLNGKWGTVETDYGRIGAGFKTGLDDVLIWTGVTNNPAYKTDKMVMRKIHAKGKTWLSGDPDDALTGYAAKASRYYVQLSYDYYIAVFEMTQAQWRKLRNGLPSGCGFTGDPESPQYPVNMVYRYDVYAHPNTEYTSYWGLVTGTPVIFPTNSYVREVGGNTTCSALWNRTKVEFTLPLASEWEFACKGGNDTALYSGKPQTYQNVQEIACVKPDQYQHPEDSPKVVGSRAPNAYGLYDMLGNALEWLNVANGSTMTEGGTSGSGTSADDPVIDPLGKTNTTKDTHYSFAGGGAAYAEANGGGYWQDCRPGARLSYVEWYAARKGLGVRLVMPATADGKWAQH